MRDQRLQLLHRARRIAEKENGFSPVKAQLEQQLRTHAIENRSEAFPGFVKLARHVIGHGPARAVTRVQIQLGKAQYFRVLLDQGHPTIELLHRSERRVCILPFDHLPPQAQMDALRLGRRQRLINHLLNPVVGEVRIVPEQCDQSTVDCGGQALTYRLEWLVTLFQQFQCKAVADTGRGMQRLAYCLGQAGDLAQHKFDDIVADIERLDLAGIPAPGIRPRIEFEHVFLHQGLQ